jgi:hypothetical protein
MRQARGFSKPKRHFETRTKSLIEQGGLMKQKTTSGKLAALLLTASALLLCGQTALAQRPAQQPEEENSRRFWPPEFRPQATTPTQKPRTGRYKPAHSTRPAAPIITSTATEPAALGVTLWLLRSPEEVKQTAPPAPPTGSRSIGASTDETARVLVKKKIGNSERSEVMIPQRVEADTPLKIGQLLRLSIEVPQDGYLYVVDREKYADGTIGDPYLIFPSNPQSNEHAVKAGRVIELPDPDYAFEVKSKSEDTNQVLAGELLSFIVTPKPLEGIPRASQDDGTIKLSKAQVEAWETQWAKNVQVQQLELEKGAGKTRTQAEQNALTKAGQELKQDDPLPQTVFQVSVKRGAPFIVQMPLKIGK